MLTHDEEMLTQHEAAEMSERLADAFRSGDAGDLFAHDLFLDGHPPFWRFQLEGRDVFASWLAGFVGDDPTEVAVVRALPTTSGFVAELVGSHRRGDELFTDRKLVVCEVRDGRISEMSVYCSGDWDAELRARHAAEAPMVRP